MWIPLRPPELAGRERAHLDPFRRLRVLARAYGLGPAEHGQFVDAIAESRLVGSHFVRARVAAGERAFVQAWEALGGEEADERVFVWLKDHGAGMLRALRA